ncbi:MAG TPA: L,D-transpeptidase, partial [Opitutus sp.]|nr:L,D-transpeptidase [Opitutus sp.]
MDSPLERITKTCLRLGIKPADRILLVRIDTATLQFYRSGVLVKSYPVSTSKRPPSNVKHSLGTPSG